MGGDQVWRRHWWVCQRYPVQWGQPGVSEYPRILQMYLWNRIQRNFSWHMHRYVLYIKRSVHVNMGRGPRLWQGSGCQGKTEWGKGRVGLDVIRYMYMYDIPWDVGPIGHYIKMQHSRTFLVNDLHFFKSMKLKCYLKIEYIICKDCIL